MGLLAGRRADWQVAATLKAAGLVWCGPVNVIDEWLQPVELAPSIFLVIFVFGNSGHGRSCLRADMHTHARSSVRPCGRICTCPRMRCAHAVCAVGVTGSYRPYAVMALYSYGPMQLWPCIVVVLYTAWSEENYFGSWAMWDLTWCFTRSQTLARHV